MQIEKLAADAEMDVITVQSDPSLMCATYLLKDVQLAEQMEASRACRVPILFSLQPTFVKIDDDFKWIQPLQQVMAEKHGAPETQTVWLLNEEVN